MATNRTTLPQPADEALLALPEETDDSSGATSGVQSMITERPLVSLGAGLIGGMILGGLLGGSSKDKQRQVWTEPHRYSNSSESSGNGDQHEDHSSSSIAASMTEGLRKAAKQSGLEDHGKSTSNSVMSSLNDSLRSVLSGQLPDFDQKLKERQHEQKA